MKLASLGELSNVGMNVGSSPTTTASGPVFNTAKKSQWCRDRVMDLFVNIHSGKRGIRLMSLPGMQWTFETDVLHEFSNWATFTAAECNDTVFIKSAGWMPGHRKRFGTMETPAGELDTCESTRATLYRCRLVDLLCASRQFGGKCLPNKRERRLWFGRKCCHNAFWLDTCNVLSHETLLSISRLSAWTKITAREVPVAVTFVRGRDGFVSDADRRSVLESAASQGPAEFELIGWDNYRGIGGAPMCLVTGVMRFDSTARQVQYEQTYKLRVHHNTLTSE